MKVLLAICAVSICNTAFSATIVTAIHAPPLTSRGQFNVGAGIGTDGSVYDNRVAQSFLATTTGLLEDVSFAGHYLTSQVPIVPLRIDVTQFNQGQPGVILATAYAPLSEFPSSMSFPAQLNITVSFAGSGVELLAGTMYALVFRTDTVEANYRLTGAYPDLINDIPGYPSGQEMDSQNSPIFKASSSEGDLYFEVSVNSVPEPSTLSLATLACVLLCSSRQRVRPRDA